MVRSIAPHRSFGLLGVDLMVDASGRPWLLEVNNCPNISGATGHVARDARAAAWRGDVFDNRADAAAACLAVGLLAKCARDNQKSYV